MTLKGEKAAEATFNGVRQEGARLGEVPSVGNATCLTKKIHLAMNGSATSAYLEIHDSKLMVADRAWPHGCRCC